MNRLTPRPPGAPISREAAPFGRFSWWAAALILSAFALPVAAQAPPDSQAGNTEKLRPNYVLGPGDQIIIRAFEMEEISEKPFSVDGDGNINVPVVGRVKAAGLTVAELERKLVDLLRKYVRQPQVTVSIVQFRSEPVFFVGTFKNPGIYPLRGRRTLVEMLSSNGGLLPNASRRIKVTRRKEFGAIPLATAVESADGKESSVIISMGSLRENVNPAEDIELEPFDVVSVERAEMIYVNGYVGHAGGFELAERDSMSVVQLLSLAGGLNPYASPTKARILRPVLNTDRRAEIPLNLNRILEGKDRDVPLLANDLLYIPGGTGFKRIAGRAALIALPLAATISIALLVR